MAQTWNLRTITVGVLNIFAFHCWGSQYCFSAKLNRQSLRNRVLRTKRLRRIPEEVIRVTHHGGPLLHGQPSHHRKSARFPPPLHSLVARPLAMAPCSDGICTVSCRVITITVNVRQCHVAFGGGPFVVRRRTKWRVVPHRSRPERCVCMMFEEII